MENLSVFLTFFFASGAQNTIMLTGLNGRSEHDNISNRHGKFYIK